MFAFLQANKFAFLIYTLFFKHLQTIHHTCLIANIHAFKKNLQTRNHFGIQT